MFLHSHLQSALPANGASNVSRQRNGRVKEMYQEFVTQRTLQNWKYWIVSRLIFMKFSCVLMELINFTLSIVWTNIRASSSFILWNSVDGQLR